MNLLKARTNETIAQNLRNFNLTNAKLVGPVLDPHGRLEMGLIHNKEMLGATPWTLA